MKDQAWGSMETSLVVKRRGSKAGEHPLYSSMGRLAADVGHLLPVGQD